MKTIQIILWIVWLSIFVNAQERPINKAISYTIGYDAFRVHNIHYVVGKNYLDYYGSGDVNNDGKIDSLDLSDWNIYPVSYRSDIDGNGQTNSSDLAILKQYLSAEIEYLPGNWNKLKSKEERISWIEKMLPIELALRNNQEFTRHNDSLFVHAEQGFINFNGISNIGGYFSFLNKHGAKYKLDSNANGLFNLPVYSLYQPIGDESGFFIFVEPKALQILVGDNPLEIDNWYKWDFRTNKSISFGVNGINENKSVYLGSSFYLQSPISPSESIFFRDLDIIKWVVKNAEQISIESFSPTFLRNSPRRAQLNIIAPNDTLINASNPDLLSEDYGKIEAYSIPTEGEDFYFSDDSLFSTGVGNDIVGEIYLNKNSLIVDTTFLSQDKKHYKVKKKIVIKLIEKNTLYNPIVPNGFAYDHILKVDSVYQNIEVKPDSVIVRIKNQNEVQSEFTLFQNYPNPFNPSTTITYSIQKQSNVSLKIYDLLGNEVANLINEEKSPGTYKIKFNGNNLTSGVYFYRLQSDSFSDTKKFILMK